MSLPIEISLSQAVTDGAGVRVLCLKCLLQFNKTRAKFLGKKYIRKYQ